MCMSKVNDQQRLAVQQWRLHTSTAGGMGSIPDGGTKIPRALWDRQKIKAFKNKTSD